MARTFLACVVTAAVLISASSVIADSSIVADIGTTRVSLEDFRSVLTAMRQPGDLNSTLDALTPAGREKVLNALVNRTLFALGAKDEGIDKLPAVQFLVEQAVAEILAKKYVESKLATVPVSDETLKQYYAAHSSDFVRPGRAKASHILVKSRDEADSILTALRNGGDFETLAREHSIEAGTKEKGGDLGWINRGVMVKPFDAALFSLKKGETSGVVQTSFGFHIIRVDDVEEPRVPPYDAIKESVRQRVLADNLAAVRSQLALKYPVTIHHDVLDSMGK